LLEIEAEFPIEEKQFLLSELIRRGVAAKQEEIMLISVTASQEF
jgi:hypothetical protein